MGRCSLQRPIYSIQMSYFLQNSAECLNASIVFLLFLCYKKENTKGGFLWKSINIGGRKYP